VISVLAILRRREQVSEGELGELYNAGDELASIISGLIDATLKEESSGGHSPRTREESGAYLLAESPDQEL
jgi:hypothetical protein